MQGRLPQLDNSRICLAQGSSPDLRAQVAPEMHTKKYNPYARVVSAVDLHIAVPTRETRPRLPSVFS